MFMPVEKNNKCNEFFGVFKPSEGMVIDDPEMIAKAYGREVARVGAGGKVTVTINLTERNMMHHGYVTDLEFK